MINIVKTMDKKLLLVATILFLFGLVMIYSASNVTAFVVNEANPGRYFIRELLFLVSGTIGCIFAIRLHTRTYSVIAWLTVIGMGIVIACLALYGKAVNGSYSWIGYAGFGIQPSEFVKLAMIPLFATYYEFHIKDNKNLKKMIFPLIAAAIIAILIVLQNDYGSAFIFILISASMFFIAPVGKKIKFGVFLVGIIGIALLTFGILVGKDNFIPMAKLERFNFVKPCERYLTTGNQLCNGYIAIHNGGLMGKGLGNSTQKYLYLPEGHTDFIFAIIMEELGVVGAISLMLLYAYLLVRIVVTGKKALKVSHQMMCYGVAIYFFLHIFINLGGVLGLLPLTGIPLAFMSYGGSFCWTTLIALTIVARVNYETKKISR